LLSFFLLVAAFAAIQVLIGGTRLVYSLPAYGLLGALGLLAFGWLRRPKPNPAQLCLISSALFFGYILEGSLQTQAALKALPYQLVV
jgi:hypothetical protein